MLAKSISFWRKELIAYHLSLPHDLLAKNASKIAYVVTSNADRYFERDEC